MHDVGTREEVFHCSLLTLAPEGCENRVCVRGCSLHPQID
jgi:hypothetical protein